MNAGIKDREQQTVTRTSFPKQSGIIGSTITLQEIDCFKELDIWHRKEIFDKCSKAAL